MSGDLGCTFLEKCLEEAPRKERQCDLDLGMLSYL